MRSSFAAMILLASAATLAGATTERGEIRRLTVLHTSDIHGSVLPVDDTRGAPVDHSMAQLATLVERLRQEVDHPILLLDSGDTIQGTPFELLVNVRWGRPSPTVELMNRMGYDAAAVGNHEFNFGLEVLRRAEATAAHPVLAANAVFETSGKPAFQPYEVFDLDGLRVGVLGLITPNIPGWERPENYRGLRFEPMDEAARHWVPLLRQQESCDLVVVLAHTGLERDPESTEGTGTEHEDFAWRLSEVEGIDLLLTGHSHDNIPPRRLGATIVSQPASHARYLTRIDLVLAKENGRWTVRGWTGQNLPARGVEASPAVVAAYESVHAEVVAALDRPLTTATGEVSVARCRLEDCAALDLIHRVQLDATGAQLSLAAILSDRTSVLEPGPVSWHWVYGLYVYPNTVLKVAVTGQQVKDILEHIASYYDGLDCPPEGSCVVLTDPRIRRYNVDSMAGVSYRIDPTRAEGDRVWDLRYEGEPLDLHASFTLACNNYRAAGGGAYPHLTTAEQLWTSSTEVAELIGAYLEKLEKWQPETDGNWSLAPRLEGEKSLSETR